MLFAVVRKLLIALSIMVVASFAAMAEEEVEAPFDKRSPAQAVIADQMGAFRARAHERAFSHAAPNLRKIFGSTERFIGMVKSGYGPIYDAMNWQFGRSRMRDGQLYQELLVTGPSGRSWKALYTMQQLEDGSWRIAGVRLIPGEAHST